MEKINEKIMNYKDKIKVMIKSIIENNERNG